MRKVLSWIIALFGLWEFADISALFVPGFGTIQAFMWNHIIVGLLLMFAGTRAALTNDPRAAKTMDWIPGIAGGWLTIASFILGNPSNTIGLWNDIIVGIIIIILGVWAALAVTRGAD